MAIYYKDFNGKVRTVVAGKAPFPVADNLTVGGVKVTGGPGESTPYKVMSEGAVNSKLFDYAKKEHTHLMKDVYKLDETMALKAPIGHTHDDRYYTESEVDGKINQISTRIGQVDSELSDKAPIGHTHTDYLTKTQAGEVYQPKSAMALYATKEDLEKMGGAGYIYQLAEFDTTASQECLQALKNKKSIEEIVADPLAWTAVIQSSSALRAISNSETAGSVIANHPDAFMGIISLPEAVRIVAESVVIMKAIAKSSQAMLALKKSSKTKTFKDESTGEISGRFIPLISNLDREGMDADNGYGYRRIGTVLGGWIKNCNNGPCIAIKIKKEYTGKTIIYYDLNA